VGQSPKASGPLTSSRFIIANNNVDPRKKYQFEDKTTGAGACGVVSKTVEIKSQAVRAVKSIQKDKIRNIKRFKLEVDIMK